MGDEREETSGEVRLVVPAAPEYLRLVRLTAAGLASRAGFTFDEVEDLRIAVDELCFPMVAHGEESRTMELRYESGRDYIAILGETTLSGPAPEPNELSERILSALVDEHSVEGDGGGFRFRLVKRRETT